MHYSMSENCIKACCLAASVTLTACTSYPLVGFSEYPMQSGDERSTLNDVAIRRLLSGAHIAPFLDTNIVLSHPLGENFLANGVYQRVSGRTAVEGVFSVNQGLVCVEGADIPRHCRKFWREPTALTDLSTPLTAHPLS